MERATALLERLMHLNPVSVKGYILDGVATTSGASPDEFPYFSKWDADVGQVAEYFLGLCALDSDCKAHFPSGNLSLALRNLQTKLDKEPNSTCATLVSTGVENSTPSNILRATFAVLLKDAATWTLIPPVVYRLARCNANEVKVLTQYFDFLSTYNVYASPQESMPSADILYNLIVFSEMWETPTPSEAELDTRFRNTIISGGSFYGLASSYCAFSKEKSAACDELNLGNYNGDGIVYKRDRYWNKAATLPTGVSVLLMNGKMDQNTKYNHAEALFKVLGTTKMELISFDYAVHGIVRTTRLEVLDDPSLTCGMKLLVSYIRNNGDLQRLDRSCVKQMPPFHLKVSPSNLRNFLGTDEAYNGIYQGESSSN